VKPAQQRERVGFLVGTFGVGVRRACNVIKLNRATYYCKSKAGPLNAVLRERIKAIAAVRIRYGYRTTDWRITGPIVSSQSSTSILANALLLKWLRDFVQTTSLRYCNALAVSGECPRFCGAIMARNSSPSRSINGRSGTKSALISRAQGNRRTTRLLNRLTEAFVGNFSTHPTSKQSIRRETLREFGATSTITFARTQCWPTKHRKSLPLQHESNQEADFLAIATVY